MYLGVLPILKNGRIFALGPESSDNENAIDYVVKMRRLPADRMLDVLVSACQVDTDTIRALAALVADFRGNSSQLAVSYGSAAEVWRLIVGELNELERLIGLTLTREQFSVIESYCRRFIPAHWELLNRRAAEGRVREGHGDLRCEHICIESAGISIFDCVEFSERFRYCDIASEIAFLAMDLDRLGAPALAHELVGTVSELTEDDELPALIPFYKCYRAVIRGVVESLRGCQDDILDNERKCAIRLAENYFSLACHYASSANPALLVVCGLSGTGKSTLARELHNRFGFSLINSDRVQKKLAGIASHPPLKPEYKGGIYSDSLTELTYTTMIDEAEQALKNGSGVILDATFKDPFRLAVLEAASRLSIPVLFVECRADEGEVRRRLLERECNGDGVSDATFDIYLQQKAEFVAITEVPKAIHIKVDTSPPHESALAEIEHSLATMCLAHEACVKCADHADPLQGK